MNAVGESQVFFPPGTTEKEFRLVYYIETARDPTVQRTSIPHPEALQ